MQYFENIYLIIIHILNNIYILLNNKLFPTKQYKLQYLLYSVYWYFIVGYKFKHYTHILID